MTYLSNDDLSFFRAGLFGKAPQVVRTQVGALQQGNGNWTGIERKTYDDGSHTDHHFIVNARSRADAIAAHAA